MQIADASKNEKENWNENWPITMHMLLQSTAHGATTCSVHSSFPSETLDTFASALYTDCSCIQNTYVIVIIIVVVVVMTINKHIIVIRATQINNLSYLSMKYFH